MYITEIGIRPLTKKETKQAEEDNIPFMNLVFHYKESHPDLFKISSELVLKWKRFIGIRDINSSIYQQNDLISKALGFKPQYYVVAGSENYRNAAWGFKYQDCPYPFVLYNSKKGDTLYANQQISPECLETVIIFLMYLRGGR